MILEPIKDFTRAPFVVERGNPGEMDIKAILEKAQKLETRAEHYYLEAAEKIHAIPEVARELRRIAGKHARHRETLDV